MSKPTSTPETETCNNDAFFEDYERAKEILAGNWVEDNSAILIFHGIGHQFPLQTLDEFTRGLVDTLEDAGIQLSLEHRLARKMGASESSPWFDNYIRITRVEDAGQGPHVDVFEYYWAPETEAQATFKDLNNWITGVTDGAKKFYINNNRLAEEHLDDSLFIKNNKFRPVVYSLVINIIPIFIAHLTYLMDGLMKVLSFIPFAGPFLAKMFSSKLEGPLDRITNILNDIAIYNTTDAKSRFFKIRNCILDGAVNALRYLLEERKDEQTGEAFFPYGKVLLCGHSLGSQIAFDAVNSINHLANQEEIKGYDCFGLCNNSTSGNPASIYERLAGFVTFGSPLDKVAFFFRDQALDNEWLRARMLSHFHGFKQRDWLHFASTEKPLHFKEVRLFDDIPWRNYWDKRDYVSGSLDYYKNLVNVDCKFMSRRFSFTHSYYWNCKAMYADFLLNILFRNTEPPPGHTVKEIALEP